MHVLSPRDGRYEKEMEATRLAADAALQDMKRVLGVEKKKAVQEAKDDMEREMNARDKSRQAIEEEVTSPPSGTGHSMDCLQILYTDGPLEGFVGHGL